MRLGLALCNPLAPHRLVRSTDSCAVRFPEDLNRVIWSDILMPTELNSGTIIIQGIQQGFWNWVLERWCLLFVSGGNPSWFLDGIFCWSPGFWLLPRTLLDDWSMLMSKPAVLMVTNQTRPVYKCQMDRVKWAGNKHGTDTIFIVSVSVRHGSSVVFGPLPRNDGQARA